MSRRPRAAAFTLIELLVVIAVLGILMALLLPISRRVADAGHATTCRGHLRQMAAACALYAEEHRDHVPRRGQGQRKLEAIDRESDWFNCLLPYLDSAPYYALYRDGLRPREGDRHVLICPVARDPGWKHFLPYGMNLYLSPWRRPDPHRLDELPRPNLLVFLADSPGPYCATMPSRRDYGVEARHHGRANLVFLDGHAGAFDATYLGCGSGDPHRPDVRWETDSEGINWSTTE